MVFLVSYVVEFRILYCSIAKKWLYSILAWIVQFCYYSWMIFILFLFFIFYFYFIYIYLFLFFYFFIFLFLFLFFIFLFFYILYFIFYIIIIIIIKSDIIVNCLVCCSAFMSVL
ncbi:hypothetical protein BY996DRAFT_1442094 [Phakopsora pachyrhizi]|nr:hypothetical protein BY996DRAFT_1442094 [Phakopsora pachyrhizi]